MPKFLFTAYSVIALLNLWLRSAVPTFAIGPAAHDDLLFVRLAYQLGAGNWLGPYDNLTLAKGLGYPIFILASFVTGIPLKLGEQILYLAVAGTTAWLVVRLTERKSLGLLLFAALAFNPVLWHSQLARVIREGIYVSLSFAVLMLSATLLLQRTNRADSRRIRAGLAVALSLVAAMYWLTREEGIWLAPALAVLVAGAVVNAWVHANGDRALALRTAGTVFAPLGLALSVFVVIVASVATINVFNYGAFQTNEFHAASFRAAYGALTRIHHDAWRRHVLFPKDAREKAYAESAAARELRPTLDGEIGENWRQSGCRQTGIDPCREILSGWFMWAFRDAVAKAGHYASAREAFAFYDRLAGEINRSCDDGRLPCGNSGLSIYPPFRWHYISDAFAIAPRLIWDLTTLGNGDIGAPTSIGPSFLVDLFEELVGPVSRAEPIGIAVRAFAAAKEGGLYLSVVDTTGGPHKFQLDTQEVERAPAPLQAAHFVHIDLSTDCVRATCLLLLRTQTQEHTLPITQISGGSTIEWPGMQLLIARIVRTNSGIPSASQMRRKLQLKTARVIASAYAATVPVLSVCAALGMLIFLILRRRHALTDGVFVLALACGVAVLTRILLVAYTEVSLIPGAANVLYTSPATAFLIVFVVLGNYLGIIALRETHWRRPATEDTN